MIKVTIEEENKLVVWTHIDEIIEEDLHQAIDETKEYKERFSNLRLLELNYQVPINFGIKKTLEILTSAKQYFHLFDSVKHAFVSDKPKNIAAFIMIITSYISKKHKTQVFTTKKAAIDWLISE